MSFVCAMSFNIAYFPLFGTPFGAFFAPCWLLWASVALDPTLDAQAEKGEESRAQGGANESAKEHPLCTIFGAIHQKGQCLWRMFHGVVSVSFLS